MSCIVGSVGPFRRNDFVDVKMVQTLFNLNRHRFSSPVPRKLEVDGLAGRLTFSALERFETAVLGRTRSHSTVTPDDPTSRELVAGQETGLSLLKLTAIMPHALPKRVELFFQPLVDAMAAYGIDTNLRRAHFLAQIGHESGSLRFTEELADGSAYEGRTDLGNTQPGDGKRFKGRGLIQLTGRANYQEYSNDTGIDYVAQPRLLATDPEVAADVAGWFWAKRGLNALADADDVRSVTRRINGGFNGLDDRVAFLRRAKCLLGL